MAEIKILGIDPATTTSGWALLALEGADECIVAGGLYRFQRLTSPRDKRALYDIKLHDAYCWLRGCIATHRPDQVALETPFYKLNARTLVALAQFGAMFRLAATVEGLPVVDVPPASRCTALGLPGNANKAQVLYTVNAVYNLNLTDHNQADAVAVAAAAALAYRQAQWTKEER